MTDTSFLDPVFYFARIAVFIVIGLWAVSYAISRFKIVPGQTALVIERLGVPQPHPKRRGPRFIPPFSKVRYTVDLRQKQIERESQVKTSDDAFVNVKWVLRFSVEDTDAAILSYTYKVEKPVDQVLWRVENELRALISGITMAELYQQKDQLARRIIADQATDALETGLHIDGVVIEQPMPPQSVREAMNAKLAALARQDAAAAEAEAERRKRVGLARAEAESKELQGQGIARQRRAIAEGFKDAVSLMHEGLPEASTAEITAMLLQANQNDMVTTAAQTGRATLIFVPLGMAGTSTNLVQMASTLTSEHAVPSAPASLAEAAE